MTHLKLFLSLLLLVSACHASALTSKQGVTRERSLVGGKRIAQQDSGVEDSVAQPSSLSEVELVPGDEDGEDEEGYSDGRGDGKDAEGESQHFLPSFAPLFSGSPLGRPPLFDDHPRAFPDSYRALYNSEEGVLGSGNFGVLRGGTYYGGQGDEEYNGHGGRGGLFGVGGRGSNPAPPYRHGGDFFAGFRDFADITTPPKPAFSRYVVVYANPKSQEREASGLSVANNILEQLALLDRRPSSGLFGNQEEGDDEKAFLKKKTSKAKQKLANYKESTATVEARKKNKYPKDLSDEPLLALS